MLYSKRELTEKSSFHVARYNDGFAIFNRYNKLISSKFATENIAWEQLEAAWLKRREGSEFKLGEPGSSD